ncbi:hypothetical protein CsSME_00032663 [Camellia sinensis var. sinensis]
MEGEGFLMLQSFWSCIACPDLNFIDLAAFVRQVTKPLLSETEEEIILFKSLAPLQQALVAVTLPLPTKKGLHGLNLCMNCLHEVTRYCLPV